MIVLALIIYLGVLVGASSWFFWVAGILGVLQIIAYGAKLYKKGKQDR